MQLHVDGFYPLSASGKKIDAAVLLALSAGRPIHAVAGIGRPARFFTLLRSLGFDVIEHAFPDHHAFRPEDIDYGDVQAIIVMTEKDAVKCRDYADARHWCLAVSTVPDAAFSADFVEALKTQ